VYWVWGHERALVCMNVELHTFVMCVGNLTFVFWNSVLCLFLSSSNLFLIFSLKVFISFSIPFSNSNTFCVNNLDLFPLTDSYFTNKLLTLLQLFEMTYYCFILQNTRLGALMLSNSNTRSGKWLLEDILSCTLRMYTKFDGVLSWKAIVAESISFLKDFVSPLLFYCLSPMKNIMNNSVYGEHTDKFSSYELLRHCNPQQMCVNTGTHKMKPSFNVRQVSELECCMLFEKWLEMKYTCLQIYTIRSLLERQTPPANKMPSASRR
jgi:hypothetical protein